MVWSLVQRHCCPHATPTNLYLYLQLLDSLCASIAVCFICCCKRLHCGFCAATVQAHALLLTAGLAHTVLRLCVLCAVSHLALVHQQGGVGAAEVVHEGEAFHQLCSAAEGAGTGTTHSTWQQHATETCCSGGTLRCSAAAGR